ncbi:MAG: outer membrane beta-barrel protein [Cyclobacteriaceae bacterium]|nr:outer membrane beta-barrel protein [Cyclobacteriaceae bacterium]
MKTLLAFLCLLFFSYSLSAQRLKPSGGLNFSNVSSSEDVLNGKSGWQIGLGVEFGEGKMYVEPGIYYTSKNLEFSQGSSPNLQVGFPELNGIRIPLNLGMYLIGNSESLVAWRAFGGPSVFFLLDQKDFGDELQSTNWGVFAGTGLNISFLFIDLSYEWSVTNISTQFASIDFGRTNGFFANAGFRLKL